MSDGRLRIAFVYDALYPYVSGGAELRYHEVARRLSARHDVHLVSWTWWDGAPDASLDGMTLHGVGRPPALYGADGKRTVREAAAFAARVVPVLLRNRWDVIDCSATPYLPLVGTWLATRLARTRLIATWHEYWGDHWLAYLPRRPVVAHLARLLEAGSARLGDDRVAVSDFTARALPHEPERTRVVPNGVTLSDIDAAAIPADAAEVVYLGRLIDEKRVDLLIETAARLRQQLPDLRCSIIGAGPELDRLTALAERLGVSDRVTFHGQLDRSEAYGRLRGARVLVLPSVREGFGMAVAEAQAAGTVPIVVRAPANGAVDLVRDGVDGLVVDPSVSALADALAGALTDPARLASMADAARQVGALRDWDCLAERMEAIYGGAPARAEAVASLGSA